MDAQNKSHFRVGDWLVDADAGRMTRSAETIRLDVRAMRLLLCLTDRAGQVVSIDDLISHVWGGVAVSPDSVYQAVTALRRQLGDDSRKPAYIETVPRLGYRMIARVGPEQDAPTRPSVEPAVPDESGQAAESFNPSSQRRNRMIWAAIALATLVALAFALHYRNAGGEHSTASAATPPQASVAVLPFLDLTEGMHSEEFADGMTEELIDKISKIPGLSVPSATSSFYYKEKQIPVVEMANKLGVTYILDGSVRKAGGRVRIAARLVRAQNSYVIWTETYDRPLGDLIMVQDDIAGEVAKALKSSIPISTQPGGSH